MIGITLQHGKAKVAIEVDPAGDVAQIMGRAWREFSVPLSAQKVIFKGKTLHMDAGVAASGVGEKAKVMIMGSAVEPDGAAEAAFAEHEQLVARLTAALDSAADAKARLAVGQECDRALTALDALSIAPQDDAGRARRKGFVRQYQQLQEAVDRARAGQG